MAGEQILVVEDNERSMKLFRDVLQASGYRTLEATTGGRAVQLAAEHRPDLVLMDIQLPDIDGVEALGRLRSDERTASMPVLALTALAMQGDRERFLAAGFDGYISKPVDIVELVGTVKQHCDGREALEHRLQREVEELRASRERLVRASDADRRRIERELHDGPQQRLVALAVSLQLARRLVDDDPPAARRLLDEIGRDVQEALEETRKLVHRIYPPLLEAGGLGVALRTAAAGFGAPTDVQVATGAACPPEVAGTVYFCCVEALEWMGAGVRSTITVRQEEAALVFEILERGSGSRDGVAAADLAGMQERVESLGGRLTINAEPGRGARIFGSLPMSRES